MTKPIPSFLVCLFTFYNRVQCSNGNHSTIIIYFKSAAKYARVKELTN